MFFIAPFLPLFSTLFRQGSVLRRCVEPHKHHENASNLLLCMASHVSPPDGLYNIYGGPRARNGVLIWLQKPQDRAFVSSHVCIRGGPNEAFGRHRLLGFLQPRTSPLAKLFTPARNKPSYLHRRGCTLPHVSKVGQHHASR